MRRKKLEKKNVNGRTTNKTDDQNFAEGRPPEMR
jgi:hypothetical protein